jgi:hypothetical protein
MTRHYKRLPVYAAIAALGALSSQQAVAVPIMETELFNLNDTLGQSLEFDLFDNSNGILTGVFFTLTSNWKAVLAIDYDGPEGGAGIVEGVPTYNNDGASTHGLSITSVPGIGGPFSLGVGSPLTVNCTYDGTRNRNDPKLCNNEAEVSAALNGDLTSLFSTPALGLLDFTGGPGTFNIDISALAQVDSCTRQTGTSGDSPTCDATTEWSGSLKLEYTYREPVAGIPEPTSVALLGFGLAALTFIRRRKVAGTFPTNDDDSGCSRRCPR